MARTTRAKAPRSSSSSNRYNAAIEQYARDVVGGAIPAGRYVVRACQRHLDDLARQGAPNFPYIWDADAARRICRFAEMLPHVKGEWARKRELLKLQPWECFALGVPFGWKRADGTRRFREIYDEIPRKNGKSIIGAVIGNYMFVADGEFGAEVYSGATSEKQAWEVFGPARLMLQKSPKIVAEFGVDIGAKNMARIEDASKFEPLIGNPGDGANVHCSIIDEYHEHITPSQYNTMVSGTGARRQPMIAVITTAGESLSGPCYDKHLEARRVLDGVAENEELFALIYSIDPEDDWADPAVLRKANPNYGVSVGAEFLQSQQRQAVLNVTHQNRFRTKHLNVWCSAHDPWMPIQQWELAGDAGLQEDDLAGGACVFAIDLASKTDLCAVVRLHWRTLNAARHFYAFCHCYLPEDELEHSGANAMAYRKWTDSGLLTLTGGATVDYEVILDDVRGAAKKFNPIEAVYDPFNATHFAKILSDEGLTMVEFNQRPQNFAVPMDEVVAAVKDGRFHHDGNPMLTWMIANTAKRPVKKGLFAPMKEKSEQKIDGSVALIMGMARAMAQEDDGGISSWLASPVLV